MTTDEIKAKFASFRCRHGLKRDRVNKIVAAAAIRDCECCSTMFATLRGDQKMCRECERLEKISQKPAV